MPFSPLPITYSRWRRLVARLMVLCALFSVLLEFTHAVKLSPDHHGDQSQHFQQHLSAAAHPHEDGHETFDDGELVQIKVHVFMHANLGYYMASAGFLLPLPKLQQPLLSQPSCTVAGLNHRPPVPPPLV